jgi:hypothetical protein
MYLLMYVAATVFCCFATHASYRVCCFREKRQFDRDVVRSELDKLFEALKAKSSKKIVE